jgi:predicted nucleic acid-binding protein
MYRDSAYLAKYYFNEQDSAAVRNAIQTADFKVSSLWVIAEVTCVFHCHVREGALSGIQAHDPGRLLRRAGFLVGNLPPNVFLRAGDAVDLTTAVEAGESEIWTNDRHLLAAAPHFGLAGRTV